ncbi:hypothetical protein ONZ45_g15232 [Pleurotus djamor]|nr:hypothetical protein ONZ45_g15232 [Pleurotus djamor]
MASETPLSDSDFNLDVGGIVGFLGGEEAISAMESLPFYKFRKWLGWYNSPGSYTIARHYGQLARSRLWDGLYPGPNEEPASFLGMDGKSGPKYRATVSGTVLSHTGHVGYIFAKYCQDDVVPIKATLVEKLKKIGRKTVPCSVTIAELSTRKSSMDIENRMTYSETSSSPLDVLIALFAIALNLLCCVVCGVYREWYAFGVILYGIICNGMAAYVIGSAEIFLHHPKPSDHSPPGDGILVEGNQFVVVKGTEHAVNHIVKAKFVVKFGESKNYHKIGLSAMSLTFQFLAQLFLIPQAGLFGQTLFLATLGVSWIYNAFLSSIDKEQLQQNILKENLPLRNWRDMAQRKVELPTRTSAVVFAMLCALPVTYMQKLSSEDRKNHAQGILDSLLPKDTIVWRRWREIVLERTDRLLDQPIEKRLASSLGSELYIKNPEVDPLKNLFVFSINDIAVASEGMADDQKNLLKVLLVDTQGAYEAFYDMFVLGDTTLLPDTNSVLGSVQNV